MDFRFWILDWGMPDPLAALEIQMMQVQAKMVSAFALKKVIVMKPIDLQPKNLLVLVAEEIAFIGSEWRRQKLPLYLFLAMCLNLVVAPVVYAASEGEFSRVQAWVIGLLGLVTVALSIYLFFVMFQPERF